MLSLYKELNYHKNGLSHILILKDGRLSSSSADNTLIIYNKNTFEPDLIIKEHTDYVNYHIQLKNENIVTCSWDNTLKIIKLYPNNNYEVIQILTGHKNFVDKAIELEDGNLLTCSDDNTIILWNKNPNNNLYEFKKRIITSISDEFPNTNIVLINDNLLLCSSLSDCKIRFFELKNDFQLIFYFDNIECCFSRNSILYLEDKDLLFVGGMNNNGIYLFKLKKIPNFIGKFFNDWIKEVHSIILLSDGDILMGIHEKQKEEEDFLENQKYSICKFRINENNKEITLLKKMENAHNDLINGIIDWKERDLIVSCSKDMKVKLWNINKD